MTVKVIETVYDDYRFRSRLEARWAVFFNALEIKYEYEKEGYDLHYSGWYLPDFYLPLFRSFVEIKPDIETRIHRLEYEDLPASKKARELSMATGKQVVLVFGDPLAHRACWFRDHGAAEFPDAAIDFDFEGKYMAPTFYEGQIMPFCDHVCGPECETSIMKYTAHREAAIAARQARFGKNGRG